MFLLRFVNVFILDARFHADFGAVRIDDSKAYRAGNRSVKWRISKKTDGFGVVCQRTEEKQCLK
jgi:hypothetical protein